jgi:8-oxo-dGTP pyrophosphatase MutT (NUDIX family)
MRPAATVLLLREIGGELEVLMMRRDARIAFMGGMWVFPGGRVDAADTSPLVRSRVPSAVLQAWQGRLRSMQDVPLAEDESLALLVAACRETFEESGVLLATDRSGAPCCPERAARLQDLRARVAGDATAFGDLLEREDLVLDLGPLVYWSHWITPSLEPKRYDTRFFAIALPADQAASADRSELTDHAWIRPAQAEQALARGEIRVVPPTLLTLEDLAESHARHGGLAGMLAAERERAAPPVMPRIDVGAGEVRVVMPWDPGYGDVSGEGCLPAGGFPPHLLRRRSCLAVVRDREAR